MDIVDQDQTAHSVQSDLDLHCPQKLIMLSSVRKDLTLFSLQHAPTMIKIQLQQNGVNGVDEQSDCADSASWS